MPASYPKLRRRHALQLLAGFSGAAFLHACNSSGETAPEASGNPEENSAEPSMSMTLGTAPWIGQLPLYIAQEKGFYEEQGLDFTLRNFGTSGDYLAAFVSGDLDSLSLVSSEALTLAAQGKDYKIVLIQDNSVGGDGILAKDDISSIADLKDKKIAADTSGVSYFFLLQVLEEAGLSEEDVSIVNMDPAAAAAAFLSNNVEAAVTYSPYLQQTADEVTDGEIIYDSSQMPTAIIDLYLFDTQYVEENPEAVQAFVNATLKGLQYIEENPEESYEIGARALELTPEEVATDLKGVALPDRDTNLAMMTQPDSELYVVSPLEDLADFLVAEEQVEAKPENIANLIDPQFVQAASF